MRDFARTSEPAGEAIILPAPHPRFVVQKHAATRLHYDFRLEIDGVFKSWAVTNRPSADPKIKRLAVETEDHPLDYGDFEGTIPKGQYGGGTVMLWDRGFWAPQNGDPAAALRKGELKLILMGEKMEGGYVLVRMARRGREQRDNWLLIKHRDAFAHADADDGEEKSAASGRTMAEIQAGAGKRPKPFMLSKGAAADAVWRSTSAKKAAKPAPRSRASSSVQIGAVTLTNAEKPLWPAPETDPPITKAELAAYYEVVGPWMEPHVRGRPCSIVRAPDGIDGERFFQRHPMQGASPLITRVKMRSEKQPYLQFDSIDSLLAAAQIAVVELHPSNCRPDSPDIPGRLVFDLDPAPDLGFDAVIEAAKEMRERLSALGLESFCKSTGGKGLHVTAPLKASRTQISWADAKSFAQAVCARMAADSPSRYLINMSKEKRTGKIFLDYLRNDRMATAVAPLSPRARAHAPVSMPLNWSQVRAGLDVSRFTIRTAFALLKKNDPWRDYDAAAGSLAAARRKLSAA